MNLRLFSLTWQNEHFTHNSVAMKSSLKSNMDALWYTKEPSDDVTVYPWHYK